MVEISEDRIRINVEKPYDVVIGSNLLPTLTQELSQFRPNHRFVILTDENVADCGHADMFERDLRMQGFEGIVLEPIPPGEQYKTRERKIIIEDQMLQKNIGRSTVLIALGGGVIGDLGGFVAATYLRGIPYVQIPTTVLAQADSSVGGKVAVNTPYAKNAIGAFKQPILVIQDMTLLQSLPEDQIRNGLVETVKHGFIRDPALALYVEKNLDSLFPKDPLDRDLEVLLYIARENVKIKGTVVEQDPEEKGLRRILNYGHTVGHAVEQLMGYKLDHGICVAIGMGVAGRIAMEVIGYPADDFARQQALLERIWPGKTRIPINLTTRQIIELTKKDKKAKYDPKSGTVRARYTLAVRNGEMASFDGDYATYVDNKIVKEAMNQSR